MKKNFLFAVIILLVTSTMFSCKKKIKESVEDIIVQVMSDGEWEVTKFLEGTVDNTAMFAGWSCKFNSNKTCQAKNGNTVVNGTWDGSMITQSITGHFPSGNHPLDKLNGTWEVKRTNFTFGEFHQSKNGVLYKMELTKK